MIAFSGGAANIASAAVRGSIERYIVRSLAKEVLERGTVKAATKAATYVVTKAAEGYAFHTSMAGLSYLGGDKDAFSNFWSDGLKSTVAFIGMHGAGKLWQSAIMGGVERRLSKETLERLLNSNDKQTFLTQIIQANAKLRALNQAGQFTAETLYFALQGQAEAVIGGKPLSSLLSPTEWAEALGQSALQVAALKTGRHFTKGIEQSFASAQSHVEPPKQLALRAGGGDAGGRTPREYQTPDLQLTSSDVRFLKGIGINPDGVPADDASTSAMESPGYDPVVDGDMHSRHAGATVLGNEAGSLAPAPAGVAATGEDSAAATALADPPDGQFRLKTPSPVLSDGKKHSGDDPKEPKKGGGPGTTPPTIVEGADGGGRKPPPEDPTAAPQEDDPGDEAYERFLELLTPYDARFARGIGLMLDDVPSEDPHELTMEWLRNTNDPPGLSAGAVAKIREYLQLVAPGDPLNAAVLERLDQFSKEGTPLTELAESDSDFARQWFEEVLIVDGKFENLPPEWPPSLPAGRFEEMAAHLLGNSEKKLSAEAFNRIREHMGMQSEHPSRVVERLAKASKEGTPLTGSDLNFALHELEEARLMKGNLGGGPGGLPHREAYFQALKNLGHRPTDIMDFEAYRLLYEAGKRYLYLPPPDKWRR